MKRLTRSTTNRTFAGIIGGLGEYFEVDPVVLRVLFIFFTLVTGVVPGIAAYFIAILIVPPDTAHARTVDEHEKHEG